MSSSMTGKVALVTGGSRGIGRATALALAARGADVAVGYHSREAAALDVVSALHSKGVRAISVQGDVAEWESVQAMTAEVRRELGPINVLINNAGLVYRRSILDITVEEWDELMAVNLRAAFLCVKAVIQDMLDAGGGAVVNVSSLSAITGGEVGPAYPAAKGGLLSFTRAIGRELADRGIRVNAVVPTLTKTEQAEVVDTDEEARRRLLSQLPMGRFAEPEEVAAVCAFLVSDEASYISGASIHVTGGR